MAVQDGALVGSPTAPKPALPHIAAALAVAVLRVALLPAVAVAQDDAASDRRALEAFYDATGGENWRNNTNWKTAAPLDEWHGVQTFGTGRVVELSLSLNGLGGQLPPALGRLTGLKWLYLSQGALVGPIPPEWESLESLEVLALAQNELSGSIPSWLGNLPNLRALQIYDNDFTGPIPAELGNLTRLEHVELEWNELTGPIPPELGNVTRLEHLDLSRNDLSGPIPVELENLRNLDFLGLSYNWKLSGPLPSGLSQLPLDDLGLYVTGACAPAAWREWLTTISFLGRLCDADTDVTIDVAVFYTPGAREAAGGAAAIEAVIDLMIAETNDAYAASGVRQRLALVARSEVPYVETFGDQDLRRLRDPSDGHLDEVHAIRDRTGADLVHLIVDDYGGLCGIAGIGTPWGITYRVCGGLTFAHELGHNMGMFHDRFQAQTNESGAFSNPAYGYVNRAMFEAGSPSSSRWTTIMAYDRHCRLSDISCSALPRFSNPRHRHLGDPLGVEHGAGRSALDGPADAAAVLNATGAVVAAWRDRPADGVNRPPVTVGTLTDRRLASVGSELELAVSQAFDDPDGDPLVYTAGSSDSQVVQVEASGGRVTLKAAGTGEATVGVTATDTGGLSASHLFSTTVERDAADPSVGGTPDRAVLETLFEATGGRGWRNRSNWGTSAPLGEWYGVTTNAEGRVTYLDLGGNGLLGPIPAELGGLEHLVELDLARNGLRGPIPAELGRLEHLLRLHLGGNELTGPIPAELGRLANLSRLDLRRNALTGPIPASLGDLTNLQILTLQENALTAVPAELGRLSKLVALNLSRNDLLGSVPASLGSLANLRVLNLSHNWRLSGTLPIGLRESVLEELDVFVTHTCAPAAWREWLATIVFFGSPCGEEPVTIDVAGVYTPRAREKAGGGGAIEAEIDLLIAETNEAYRTSGVRHRVALAARAEVAHTETTGDRDLEHLVDPSDGFLDEVHDLRDRSGADLVHLLVEDPYDVCGIAQVPAPYVDPGPFGITLLRCGGLVFAHELGHNMGLRHDRFQVVAGGENRRVFSHPAYGYVNHRASEADSQPSSRWRTIMSYDSQCRQFDTACVELPRFSNPRQRFAGDPLGVAHGGGSGLTGASDAVAVLNATGPAVASWRDRVRRPNRPPTAVATLPDRTMTLNAVLNVDVSSTFVDPDGDPLTYTASSSAPGVAAARVAEARVTVTAMGAGRATIEVTATDPGGLSATQSFGVRVGVTAPFTDDPIVPGVTPVRAIHFTELRTRIDGLRRQSGLAAYRWTDAALRAGVTPVRLEHLLDLREALAEAYAASGRPVPRWSDAMPVGGATPIRAAHLTELRAAVVALE